jgi:hypothetical protein
MQVVLGCVEWIQLAQGYLLRQVFAQNLLAEGFDVDDDVSHRVCLLLGKLFVLFGAKLFHEGLGQSFRALVPA